MESAIYKCL